MVKFIRSFSFLFNFLLTFSIIYYIDLKTIQFEIFHKFIYTFQTLRLIITFSPCTFSFSNFHSIIVYSYNLKTIRKNTIPSKKKINSNHFLHSSLTFHDNNAYFPYFTARYEGRNLFIHPSLSLFLSPFFFNSFTHLVLSLSHTHTHTRIRKPWRKRPVAERQFVEQVERDPFEASTRVRACNIIARVSEFIKFSRHRFAKNSPFSVPRRGAKGGSNVGGEEEEGKGNACVRDKSDH